MENIYLDSCIVIYLVERHPIFAPVIKKALVEAGDIILSVSPLVRLEVLVKPRRETDIPLQERYERFLAEQYILEMPEAVYDLALSLRVQYNLKTPDALHLATAKYHDCNAFWTNDNRLAMVSTLAVNISEKYKQE
ncbi:MAG: type II toxin-antitoxin system VapC family toxin [Thiomargarita sp.]|nr:type II toxin-antitoxin system VapC family toxin [Thiomargarita sp.]